MSWITSQYRKAHQRAANKTVRSINRLIENDDLWLGRFYIKQLKTQWLPYEGSNEYELYVMLRFIDKKSGMTYDTSWYTANFAAFRNGLFERLNWFIVEYCRVWETENPLKDERIDYRNVK